MSVAVVIITFNRKNELLRTLARLTSLPERPRVVVVDNASSDGTGDAVARQFPSVVLIRATENLGAAGRTLGVRAVDADFIAFCDDDTWWEPGALAKAAALLEAHPEIAVLTGRVLVGENAVDDPVCETLARSPVPSRSAAPGVPLVGFLAGASVVRRAAFLAAGGFEPRFFIGGEEGLLAVDLLARGWSIHYVPELVVHHHPSRQRDVTARRRSIIRNELWLSWLRRPVAVAWRRTLSVARASLSDGDSRRALAAACKGLPWVIAERRILPQDVERLLRLVEQTG